MNNFYVYKHIRKDTDEVFYIGKGSGKRAWSKGGRNQYWKNIAKNGYSVEIVLDGLNEQQALNKEVQEICFYKSINLCVANLTKDGEGISGYKYVGEMLEKQRKQVKHHMNRKDVKQKLSNIKKEHFQNPENIEKTRQAKLKSIKEKPDQVSKQRQSILKHYQSPENKRKCSIRNGGKEFQVFDRFNNVVWSGLYQDLCAKQLGIYQPNVNKCLKGSRKSTGGYTFKYNEKADV